MSELPLGGEAKGKVAGNRRPLRRGVESPGDPRAHRAFAASI